MNLLKKIRLERLSKEIATIKEDIKKTLDDKEGREYEVSLSRLFELIETYSTVPFKFVFVNGTINKECLIDKCLFDDGQEMVALLSIEGKSNAHIIMTYKKENLSALFRYIRNLYDMYQGSHIFVMMQSSYARNKCFSNNKTPIDLKQRKPSEVFYNLP